MRTSLSVIVALCALPAARADVRLHALFSEHAVLQRDRPLPVWGRAEPGEAVQVTLGAKSAKTTADKDGRWSVTLEAQPASRQPLTLTAAGRNTLAVKDVLLGDVWLCGGQSNMEWPLQACDAPDDVREADLPLVRHFGVQPHFSVAPQTAVQGQWQVCSPKSAGGFTAVGFYFGRRLHHDTGVPIGLLRSCVGGTNIELWMAQETLLNSPALEPYAKAMRAALEQYRKELQAALPGVEHWTIEARAAEKQGRPLPLPGDWPIHPFAAARPRCVTLHNGMIAPLVPFALRGAVWYQGESNAGSPADAAQYVAKNRAMLADWRRWFGDPELPFYFVQLASFMPPSDNPAGGDAWAYLREAQRHVLATPHTGMAVAIDVGEANDIHPKNKVDVGERLARWALANEYRRKVEPSGPLFREARAQGRELRIFFDHVGRGLMAGKKHGRDAAEEDPAGKLQRFAVAGKDRKWYWAAARINGDTVVVSHPDVPEPVAVRYAFSTNPAGANLYNRDGLPASPFRSDDW